MVSVNDKLVRDLITSHSPDFKTQWTEVKQNLKVIKRKVHSCAYPLTKSFYDSLCAEAEQSNFIELDRRGILNLISKLGSAPPTPKKFRYRRAKKKLSFSELIIAVFGYEDKRYSFYPGFFAKLEINACVYCNAQYASTHVRNNGKISARYELDHFKNKDDHPYLCISPFNLVPICSVCNKIKSKKDLSFELYTDQKCSSDYRFQFTAKSIADYFLLPQTNKETLQIDLELNTPLTDSIEQLFSIKSLYETQKDLAEEILVKGIIYNDSYKNMLVNSFRSLGLEEQLKERTIIGTYTKEEETHKRPMTKFIQDLAIDVGLLKR